MKRWLARTLICLILGATTTVAVAWGCAVWSHHPVRVVEMAAANDWPAAPANWSSGRVSIVTYHSFGATQHRAQQLSRGYPGLRTQAMMRFGLPSRALYYERHRDEPFEVTIGPLGYDPPTDWREGLMIPFRDQMELRNRERFLPTRVHGPGFLIDTLLYAAIWFGVFFGFASAKRFISTKRGRCPRCGYDLRGQLAQGCPECGWNRALVQSG